MGHVMEHRNRGAKRAREAREDLGLGEREPVPCLLSVVEEHFCVGIAEDLGAPDVEGACLWPATGDPVLWLLVQPFTPRQRFTLAHELGHAWLDHGRVDRRDTQATLRDVTVDHEIEANAFAAELLIPRAGLLELLGEAPGEPTLDDAVRIACAYGVSTPMAVLRLRHLKLATWPRLEALAREVAERHHTEAFHRLGLPVIEDRLGAEGGAPYRSPRRRRPPEAA